MKQYFLWVMLLLITVLTSCVNELNIDSTSVEEAPERKAAVKINTKYVEISQNIPVSEKDTPDFVGAISYQITRQTPMGMMKVGENNNTPTDDYVDPNDLPTVIEGGASETIFDDGTYESSTIRRINTALSPIFQLYEVPISYQESVTRVDINNGMMYAYNVSDQLLFSKPHQGIDMTEYIAVLDEIIARIEADSLTRSITPIERLQLQAQNSATKRLGEQYTVTEGENGCIIVEKESNKSTTRSLIDGARVKTRVTLSPDASRTLMSERFENDMLVARTRYKYANNDRFKSYLNSKEVSKLNPHKVKTEKLIVGKDGNLKVASTITVYSQNTISFNNN